MNVITLAARAILKRRYYEPEHHPDLESFYASCYPEHVMEAEAEARAVIEVMREPTPEIIEHVAKAIWSDYYDGEPAPWDEIEDEARRMSMSLARAAIEAMFALASPPTPEDAGER